MVPISSTIFNCFESSLKNNQYNINKWNEYINDNDISEEELMDIDEDGSSGIGNEFDQMVDENQFNSKSLNEKINKINRINKSINQLNPIKKEPSFLLNIQMDLLEFQIKYSKSDVGQYTRNKFECIIEDTEKLISSPRTDNSKYYNNSIINNKTSINNNNSNNNHHHHHHHHNSDNSNSNKQVSIFKLQYEMFKLQSNISGTQDETISKDIRHFFKKMFYNNNNHHHNNNQNIESSSLYTFLHLLKLYLSFLTTLIKNQLNQDQF